MSVVVAAVSGGAYLAAGEAALTYIAYAGLATTVVGALTKDKNMTELGGKMSIVGGLGSLAAGAASSTAAGATQADMLASQDAGLSDAATTGITADAASSGAAVDAAGSGASTGASAGMSQADQLAAQSDTFGQDGIKATYDAAATPSGINTGAVNPTGAAPDMSSSAGVSTPATGDASTWQTNYKAGIDQGMTPANAKLNADALAGSLNPGMQVSGKQLLYGQMGMGLVQGMSAADTADKNRAQQQQVIDQHSHGSEVKYYGKGIINRAATK